MEKEGWYGNNILSRVPKMYQVLNCPVVRGALTSIAGTNYYLHPHRAVHSSTPIEDPEREFDPAAPMPPMGKGSRAGSGWHQDAQSPLSRARHHLPRFLIGFYFPHDTPVRMGPTRFQAGSYLYANPVAPHGVVLDTHEGRHVPAAALRHGAWRIPQSHDVTRYMVKFVFARTRHPSAPSWINNSAAWQRPAACIPEYDLPETWSAIWNWMRGEPGTDVNGAGGDPMAHFGAGDQPQRLTGVYRAAAAVPPQRLVGELVRHAGQNKHERELATDNKGRPEPRDDIRGYPRCWNERAVVMEDAAYALAAAGTRTLPALEELLDHEDPWVQINAAFALGEIGKPARGAVARLAKLLDSPVSQVVRQALDALGMIGCDLAPALPKIERLLTETNLEWLEAQVTAAGWRRIKCA